LIIFIILYLFHLLEFDILILNLILQITILIITNNLFQNIEIKII